MFNSLVIEEIHGHRRGYVQGPGCVKGVVKFICLFRFHLWRKWLYRFQELAGLTEKECRAYFLVSALLLIGAVARYLPKSSLVFDEAYYTPLYEEFERLSARADSFDRAEELKVRTRRPTRHARAFINLNTASREELQTLPRVGPALSSRILDLRERLGSFLDVSDLLMVQGIGEKTLELIRDSLFVEAIDPDEE